MSNPKIWGLHYHNKPAHQIELEGDVPSVQEVSESSVSFRFENGLQYKIHFPHIFLDKGRIPTGEYAMTSLVRLLDEAIIECEAQPGLWEMNIVHANYQSIVYLGSESMRVKVEYK